MVYADIDKINSMIYDMPPNRFAKFRILGKPNISQSFVV